LGLRSCRPETDCFLSFVRYNEAKKEYVIARDHLGKCPLYFGHANDGRCGLFGAMLRECTAAETRQSRCRFGRGGPIPSQWAQMYEEGSIGNVPR